MIDGEAGFLDLDWSSHWCLFSFLLKGEELRKLIGAPAYIECSSKTQQVYFLSFAKILCSEFFCLYTQIVMYSWDDRMWKLSLTLPSKWFSNHQSKRKRKGRHRKLAPYYDRESEINSRRWLSDQLLLLHLINLYYCVPCPLSVESRKPCTVWTCIVGPFLV